MFGNSLWLYPFLYALKNNVTLNISSTLRKTMVHYSKKLGFIKVTEDGYLKLTEKGERFLGSYVPLNKDLKRLKVKGADGCFLIVVRRKKGVKVFRVPC